MYHETVIARSFQQSQACVMVGNMFVWSTLQTLPYLLECSSFVIHCTVAELICFSLVRSFGGIKLGTGGLVRAYGGVAAECLKNGQTCLVKSKVI